MKKLLLILSGYLIMISTYAQCDSAFIKPIAAGITTVSLFDTSTIIAAGSNGNIIKSANGGKSWRAISTPTSATLRAMQFTGNGTGYIAGDGIILKTEDQGESWISLYGRATVSLNGLYFFDKDNGFIAGNDGRLLATTDGGKSWKDTILSFGDNLYDITFINDSIGIVCGVDGICFRTTDRAVTWQQVTLPTSRNCQKVKFINDTTGFIIGGSGCCLKTTDAGLSWSQVNAGSTNSFFDIFFINQLTGLMVSYGTFSATIHKTTNGGNTWTSLRSLPFNEYIWNINSDTQRKKIVFAGGTYYNNRILISTTDTANTVNYLCQATDQAINDIFCFNASAVFAAANSGVFMKTSDSGESWTKMATIPGSLSGQTPEQRKLFFLDSLNGFAYSNTLYRTRDGGNSWIQKTTPGGSAFFVTAIYFSDTLQGLAQNNNYVYKTINGGNSWQRVATSPNFYTHFAVTPSGKAFTVGYNGSVQVSPDMGSTWASYNLNTNKLLTSVYFYNDNIGFIGAEDSVIFKTTDGGTTWSQINITPNLLQVKSILFLNDSAGYMTRATGGSSTNLYKTNNGGQQWYLVKVFDAYHAGLKGTGIPYFAGRDGHIFTTDSLEKPGIPGYIDGLTSACVGFKANYATGPVNDAFYNWALSGGGTNFPGANRDTVLWNAEGQYTLSLSLSNICGTSPVRQLAINAVNFNPVITISDSVYTATEGLSYQWYKNDIPIPAEQGGNLQRYIPSATGYYRVMVKSFYGCSVLTPSVVYAAPVLQPLCPDSNIVLLSTILSASFQWQRDTSSGFENISDNGYFTGTNTRFLQIMGAPSSWYGHKFRCISNYLTTDAFTLQFKNSWTGAADNTWENTANWGCHALPDENTDVYISSGTVIIDSDVRIRKLVVSPSANVVMQPGKSLTITH